MTRPDTYPRARPPARPRRPPRALADARALARSRTPRVAPRCSARLSRAARPLVESIESASRSPRRAERKTRCRSPRSRPARPSRRSRVVPRPTRRARPHSDASHRSALARASSWPTRCQLCRTRTLGIGKRPSDGACTSTLARVWRVAPEPESSTVARLGTRRESGISYTPPRAVRPHRPPWFVSSRFSEKNLSSWLTPPFAPTLPRAEFDDAFDVEVRGDEDGPA